MTIAPIGTTDNFSSQVAAEVRAMMGRRGVRQAHLARRIGSTDVWLSVRLTGRQPIDLNDLQRIAAGLECSILDLLPDAVRRGEVEQPTALSRRSGGDTKTYRTSTGSETNTYHTPPGSETNTYHTPAEDEPKPAARGGSPLTAAPVAPRPRRPPAGRPTGHAFATTRPADMTRTSRIH